LTVSWRCAKIIFGIFNKERSLPDYQAITNHDKNEKTEVVTMNEKHIADNIIKNVKIFRTRRTTGAALLKVLFVSLALVLASAFLVQAQSPNLQETLQQYISDLQNNPADNALREKIIKLAQEMKPAPTISREAEKSNNRAEYIIKNAKSDADFADAVKEYEKALLISPWVPAYYFNLGITCKKAGQLQNAVRNFKFYLLADPNAQDAQETRKQIDGLEYAIEKAMSWVTDPATGFKIGWNNNNFILRAASWSGPVVEGKAEGKGTLTVTIRDKDGKDLQGRGEAEMIAGLPDGKAALEWSDGHSYDGYYKAGKRNGKGVMKSSDGQTYDGEWKDDLRNGYGVLKDAGGKVLYDGEWKDDKRLAAPLKVDKILGIPWGASEDEAKRIMLQRPKTKYYPTFSNTKNDAVKKWQGYTSLYNDIDAMIYVNFYQGKMFSVKVVLYFNKVSKDQVMEKFNSTKQGMSQRYGDPSYEIGKYLDSVVQWDFDGGYFAQIYISKSTIETTFMINIFYCHSATNDIVIKALGSTPGQDY
jgi:hypothetical protein